jgi:ferric enterobactin receptor
MKLAVTVKYLFVKNCIKALLVIAILSAGTVLKAQKYRLTFNGIPLSEAVLRASKQLDIKVAFDARKLESKIIQKEVSGNTPQEFMENLLMNSGFYFENKHDRFLIIEKEEGPAEIAGAECHITGSVMDSETGEQLPFATVNLPEQNLITPTSANGAFYVRNPLLKPMHMRISYIGYYPIDTLINCTRNALNCDIKLNHKIQAYASMEVRGLKGEMIEYRNDVDFATTLDPSRLNDLPMLTETDVFKALQLLPGIKYFENSSELSIRGGSGDQNLVLYDGQTLYNLSHYFGVFSSLNPNIIKDIQVYKGGYDSRYGERVSGIVDITGKSGTQTKPILYGDMNLVSCNIATEIPLNKKLTLVAASRRSYSDIYSTEFANTLFTQSSNPPVKDQNNIIVQTTPSYYFYDYNAKLTYRANNNENLSLSIYGGKDYYNNSYDSYTNSLSSSNNDKNTWNNYGVSMAWLKQWSGALYTSLQIGTSGYSNQYSNTTTISELQDTTHQKYLPLKKNVFETNNQNKLADYSLSMRSIWYLNSNHLINFGLLARQNDILYHKDADKVYVYDNINQSAWVSSIYALDKISLTHNLTIKPSARLSFYQGNKQLYFEPRLSVNYQISDIVSVRGATGRFYQFLSQAQAQQETGYNKSFWVLANDSVHSPLQSNHYIVGTTIDLGNFLLDIEGYYKTYSGLEEYLYISQYLKNSDFPNYFQPQKGTPLTNGTDQIPINTRLKSTAAQDLLKASYFTIGSGQSYGLDFAIRYKLRNYNSWLSYSISRSLERFPMINQNAIMPSPTDQKHQLTWANMLSWKKWNFGTTSCFNTGRPYIDYTVNNQNIPTTRFYKRLPNYFRSDVSANYNFRLGRVKLKTGATIINIFNTRNYFDINTRKIDFDNVSFTQTNLIRSQQLSFNLFVHFSL